MADKPRIFVVLDPTCMEQAALEWGEQIVLEYRNQNVDTALHVYCCVNGESVTLAPGADAEEVQRETKNRVSDWLHRMVAQPREQGVEVHTEVEWSDDWRKAIVIAAERHDSVLVVKNMTPHSRFVRLVRETSDWTLIRECTSPVLLVKTGRPYGIDNVLVAVKDSPDDEAYEKANEAILNAARGLTRNLGANLHAVTCYEDGSRPDRQRFADRCGLARNQVSAAAGASEKVIADTAAAQNSDLVVIARVAHPDSPNTIGNTARKVIDEIDTEVLVLPVG